MNRRLVAPVGITATGQCFPPRVVTNDDLSKIMETNDEWIRSRTGIRERRWVEPGTGASQLGAPALQQALDNRGIKASELDLILVTTVTPDTLFPATACRIQDMVGASNAFGFDLNAACSGFLYALTTAASMVAAGGIRRAAVVGVDIMSTIINLEDRATSVLFGDGAGAVVLGPSSGDGRGILSSKIHADGTLAHLLQTPGGGSAEPMNAERIAARRNTVRMQGPELFAITVRHLTSYSMQALKAAGLTSAELDWVVPHQANRNIVEKISQRLGYSRKKFVENLAEYGNTGAASIPIALDEAVRDGRIQPGQTALLCALGAGLAWGAAIVRM